MAVERPAAICLGKRPQFQTERAADIVDGPRAANPFGFEHHAVSDDAIADATIEMWCRELLTSRVVREVVHLGVVPRVTARQHQNHCEVTLPARYVCLRLGVEPPRALATVERPV